MAQRLGARGRLPLRLRGKQHPLTAAGLQGLRAEHTRTLVPARALAAETQPRFAFASVEADREEELAALMGVRALPTTLVMRNGRLVEEGTPDEIFERPKEAYTQALIRAALAPAARVLP